MFRVKRIIEFGDTDMAGIVHFSNFFRYMEAAECAFLRTLGLSVAMEWEGEKIGLPRVSAACDYLRPVRFGDELEILVEVAKVGRKSLSYVFEFRHHGEAVARGRITAVCCRVRPESHGLESIEIPATFRARLEGPAPRS